MEAREAREARIQRTLDELLADGVVVCIRFRDGSLTLDASRAVVRGGLRVLEITMTTPGALEMIATLSPERGLVVGAGTVLTAGAVEEVAKAGGRFVMSPVFDREVVDAAHARGLLAIPGAATPAEILAAHRHGARLVKVFPSGALGGPAFLRALRGPLPDLPIIATSGPTCETIAEYVAAGALAVGVGSEIFPDGFTPEGAERAARRIRQAMDAAAGTST